MSTREFNPSHLDVETFAAEAGELAGEWPVRRLHRVAEALAAAPPGEDAVTWRARGERRAARGGAFQTWLHVGARAHLALECQRCLKPVVVAIEIERNFLFVQGEELAAQLDAESEDDVLAMPRVLDLQALVEDELLLAMPLVPRHEVCPEPLPVPIDDVPDDDVPHPFAALAALKRPGPLN
jgi:uncharacterized protein